MKSGIICIGNNIFETLLACSDDEQKRGLMYLEPPTPNMTFVYTKAQINKFWMKSTPAPLDILFSYNGKITQICKGEPFSTAAIGANEFSDLVIELPYGTSSKVGIKIGSPVSLLTINK
jgi:uncharacterized protein